MRACAVEMRMDISQEPFCVEIYTENAGRFRYHLDLTAVLLTYRKELLGVGGCGHTVWDKKVPEESNETMSISVRGWNVGRLQGIVLVYSHRAPLDYKANSCTHGAQEPKKQNGRNQIQSDAVGGSSVHVKSGSFVHVRSWSSVHVTLV